VTGRYAIYLAPDRDTPLWRFGTTWLGRDPETGVRAVDRFGLPRDLHAEITGTPSRYGFHGTLKPPFRLAEGADEQYLKIALRRFAATRRPFAVPGLRLGELGGFLALLPNDGCPALYDLAGDCITMLDALRAPLSDAEITRREPDRLTPVQRENLECWGYPYVLKEYRFHMTLTEKLGLETMAKVFPVLAQATADIVDRPISVSSVALFHEPAPSEPFRLISRFEFAVAN